MTNYALQEQNQDMVSLLASQFRLLYNPTHAFADAINMALMSPQLRGFWPMSSAINNVLDVSGNSRTLTRNGTVTYNADGLIPYAEFDGSTGYLSRADESGIDILGTESYVSSDIQGLTLGGWFWFDGASAGVDNMIAKRAGGGQLSYYFRRLTGTGLNLELTPDGSTLTSVTSASDATEDIWNFCCGRFIPSTEMAVWLNDEKTTNTTSIPASIFNSTAPLQISGYNGTSELLDGRASLVFLCASAVPDIFINTFYQMTAPLFKTSI